MNTQTIKVRRANNAREIGGAQHFTLTKVNNDPGGKQFAFGISDDGETEVYIPAMIVKHEQMTEADVGAGFSARIRKTTGFENGGHPQAVHPIKWDGEAEEIEISGMEMVTPGNAQSHDYPDLSDDLDKLANATDDVLFHRGILEASNLALNDMIDKIQKLKKSNDEIIEAIDKARTVLDVVAPELDE